MNKNRGGNRKPKESGGEKTETEKHKSGRDIGSKNKMERQSGGKTRRAWKRKNKIRGGNAARMKKEKENRKRTKKGMHCPGFNQSHEPISYPVPAKV